MSVYRHQGRFGWPECPSPGAAVGKRLGGKQAAPASQGLDVCDATTD